MRSAGNIAVIDDNRRSETSASLPDQGLVQLKEVLDAIRVSRTTWWRWVKDGLAPQPVKIGSVTLWRTSELKKFIEDPEHYRPSH
ncbi:MAG: hypothetical protein R8K47_04285 [Mariprofundaceae bacterium]